MFICSNLKESVGKRNIKGDIAIVLLLQYTTTLILSHPIYIYICFFISRILFSLSRARSLFLSLNYQLFYHDKINNVFFLIYISIFCISRKSYRWKIFGFQLLFKVFFQLLFKNNFWYDRYPTLLIPCSSNLFKNNFEKWILI